MIESRYGRRLADRIREDNGFQVIEAIRSTGGSGAAVSDEDIINAIQLLAETEGIFTEPAGGTTLAATIDLVKRGVIGRDESVVVCITGNGYKTAEVVEGRVSTPVRLSRAFRDFEAWWAGRNRASVGAELPV